MALLVKDLFKLDLLKEATIEAGKKGINNEIVWVNMLEILDELGSLQKGELLITTGYDLYNKEKYGNLIVELHNKGLAGIAVQPGYYIDDIPDYIIKSAESLNFPVIKIPKKITFSHVTRAILNQNINNKYTNNSRAKVSSTLIASILEKRMIGKEEKEKIKNLIKIDEVSKLYVLIFSISHNENGIIKSADFNSGTNKLSSFFRSLSYTFLTEELFGKTVILLSCDNDIVKYNTILLLSEKIADLSRVNSQLTYALGLSNAFYNLDGIIKAYEEALISEQTLKKLGVKKGLCCFSHISLIQLLGFTASKENILRFISATLHPLINYDKIHGIGLVNTLKTYLYCGCSLNIASDKLYIHRHTLRYRLNKIKELCSIDFDDHNIRLIYSFALYLDDLYN